MPANPNSFHALQKSIKLPCGAVLKNRLAKSPMSDALGDGEGNPTKAQTRLYEKWAEGGIGLSFIGEVQCDSRYPENPGNLVLNENSDLDLLYELVDKAKINNTHIWPQIGHAGALSYSSISQPRGPSAIQIKGLNCLEMPAEEIAALPKIYARAARLAKDAGFSGVHIHAGHGFLLSQFLSPLFNNRKDHYGGPITHRFSIILKIINQVRDSVGSTFPIGIRINSSDQLEGGLTEADALEVIKLLDNTSIDLIDISGGTYFPGAKSSSDSTHNDIYFLNFARRAKTLTTIPLMITGGFKFRNQAIEALESGAADIIGIGRAMILNPQLPKTWFSKTGGDPKFPQFASTIPGGITAWYTMKIKAIGENNMNNFSLGLASAVDQYEEQNREKCMRWQKRFTDFK